MIVRKTVHCIFAGTRFCCSKNAKCGKFFLNRQPPVRYEVYDRVCKENPLQRVHSCGRRLAGILGQYRSIPDGKVRNMAKYTLLKTAKKCVLCRHWNGAMGSTMIQMKTKDYFQVEMTEKQTCYQTARTTQALNSCSKFEPRY